MDLATLKALKPNEYAEAANGYRRTSDMARAAHDRVGTQIAAAMRKSLKGEAASAAIKQLAELGKNFHYVQTECGLVGSALDAFSYEMEAAKKKLDAALADAKAGGLTVHADGSVGYPPGGDKDKNVKLVADNDEKKASVNIVKMAKNDPPKLSLTVVSGCYRVPDGQKVKRF
ncbi:MULTISPECIES: hypothetical protein [Streptomyces]|uniref:Uncharacterized protein n=1 Tax=Streptomyces alboflavus TaxID=67267 RepID=A0A1Z1WJN5_9ACTN|nr:hypothetical protein [Streptomyces alboflavus]ARX86522.1 hypothetical protein SMD44_05994 [Streptomyces alboflavus]